MKVGADGLDDGLAEAAGTTGSEEAEDTFLEVAVGRTVAESDGPENASTSGALVVDGRALRERGGAGRLPGVLVGREGTARPPKVPCTREGMRDGVSVVVDRLENLVGWLGGGPSSPSLTDDIGELVVGIDSTDAEMPESNDGRNEMRLDDATVADLVRCSVVESLP